MVQLTSRRGFFGRFFRLAVGALFVALVIGVGLVGYLSLRPYGGGQTFVEIERGMSSRDIAQLLAAEGVVRSPWIFMGIRALHPKASLEAGEYRFDSPETPWAVFNKIRRGEVFYEEFTVPEGSNIFDIAALLERGDTVNAGAFLKAAADPASIRDLDPQAPDLEGYLFPSTYRVTHRTTAGQLCHVMTAEFRRQWNALGGRAHSTDVHRIVTLASLIEKETAVSGERPLVAAVFLNRLQLNMPLQCDPTTVYAALLENRYRGAIHKSDLASENPYNTYAHAGLPPGPIANPGASSLKGALEPANVDYLYFVAKGDGSGSHHFSSTLLEHEKAVLAYRKTAH